MNKLNQLALNTLNAVVMSVVAPLSVSVACTVARLFSGNYTNKVTQMSAQTLISVFNLFTHTKCKINGLENLPKSGGYIIASQHQSMYDAILMYTLFAERGYFVTKAKSNLMCKCMGVAKNRFIFVDKDDKQGAVFSLKSAMKRITKDDIIVIFPQGRRMPFDEKMKCLRGGVSLVHKITGLPVIPVALNIGKYVHVKGYELIVKGCKLDACDEKKPEVYFLPAIEKPSSGNDISPDIENAINSFWQERNALSK